MLQEPRLGLCENSEKGRIFFLLPLNFIALSTDDVYEFCKKNQLLHFDIFLNLYWLSVLIK